MRALALAVAGLLLTGCTAFMDGFCSHDNAPGGYCERYNAQPRIPGYDYGAPLRDAVNYATQNPAGSAGTICTPVRDAVSASGYSVICR